MPEIATKPEDSRKPQGGQRHRGCLILRSAETPEKSHRNRPDTGLHQPHFWQEPTNHLGIKLSTSTAFHPQADDQQRRLGRTTSARRACIQHRRIRDNQDTAVLRELRLPRDAVDPTSSVGGELHQPRERVASSTLEKLAASRMPEIAIKHYRKSRIPK
jgi:hypothetical protein